MQRLNCGRVPTIAQSLGLGENFRFWRGASGRRYVFSLLRDSDLDDLQNVILIEAGMAGLEPVPVWLGEVDHDGERHGEAIGVAHGARRRRYVHFLEGSDADRHAALNDLMAASMERTAA